MSLEQLDVLTKEYHQQMHASDTLIDQLDNPRGARRVDPFSDSNQPDKVRSL